VRETCWVKLRKKEIFLPVIFCRCLAVARYEVEPVKALSFILIFGATVTEEKKENGIYQENKSQLYS
jgi:hypothetical protein